MRIFQLQRVRSLRSLALVETRHMPCCAMSGVLCDVVEVGKAGGWPGTKKDKVSRSIDYNVGAPFAQPHSTSQVTKFLSHVQQKNTTSE